MRWIIVSECRAGRPAAPTEKWLRHQSVEVLNVQLLEKILDVVGVSLRTADELSPALLPDELQVGANIVPVDVEAIAMGVDGRDGLTEQLRDEDPGEGFENRRGARFEQIAHPDMDHIVLQADGAIHICEAAKLYLEAWERRFRPDLPKDPSVDLTGRLEEERALDLHFPSNLAYQGKLPFSILVVLGGFLPTVKISALGCYTPPRILTNQDLEKIVDTSDQWIMERTGIRSRHIADPEMATSDMAVEAAKVALAQRGIDASELDAVIICTVTPDMMFPSTACLVQHQIGASKAWGFDLVAACSGFVFGLTTAAHLIKAGSHEKVLVIGADTMSRIIDYTDRATCVLFGDGAGAMLVEASEDGQEGFLAFHNEIDGSGANSLKMPAGGSRMPPTAETVARRLHYVHQEGQQVFKYAVRKMYESCKALLDKVGAKPEDIALLVPHQANRRIIVAAAERLGIPCDKVMINIEDYGNTTAATIPLATRDAISQGRLRNGDLVVFAAVGAGYTVGANLWRWSY